MLTVRPKAEFVNVNVNELNRVYNQYLVSNRWGGGVNPLFVTSSILTPDFQKWAKWQWTKMGKVAECGKKYH